jgi:murein DD-endopeptidase MepM/ murein hydrolase activator NlpD
MRVKQGDPLGQVGNSGNSSQPHLHLHAERGGEPGEILVGEAVPITLGGRFLVRNRPLHRSLMRSTDRQPVQWGKKWQTLNKPGLVHLTKHQ